ncbi:MAG: LacI family DNA-binding transcriptional regulator, partial [Kiloniellales bacterium]|nr:LacI family DNA-binding transcriptional regulator [Kiloniellales bacterium]
MGESTLQIAAHNLYGFGLRLNCAVREGSITMGKAKKTKSKRLQNFASTRPTLEDVARRAEVSTATVSRYFSA